jgi:AbrB family looped-hinge helix DNA binding protein
MPTSTMTSKGQVTIPAAVRHDLRLEPGVRLAFTRNDDGSYRLTAATRPVTDLFGCLPKQDHPQTLSVEQMDEQMRRTVAAEALS